jgi:signal transduction histidine kinase/CheY-like chemotaxis protein/AraC-like DNA-binding protein
VINRDTNKRRNTYRLSGFFSLSLYRIRKFTAGKKKFNEQPRIHTGELEERDRSKQKVLQEIWSVMNQIDVKNRFLEMQSRFFANIVCELRTPLTLIIGPLEQILADYHDKKLEARTGMILHNARRLLDLVDQLTELAKFDNEKMKLNVSLMDITDFTRNVVMCFESLARQKGVALIFHSETDGRFLYFDREKLERIIVNLLSNAFNHTPEGGEIKVSLRWVVGTDSPEGCIEILVTDTGCGIPADQLPYIFDRFFRVTGPKEFNYNGIGIGLALTWELVKLHHGHIEVHSRCVPDSAQGTEFIIRLPIGNTHFRSEEISSDAAKNNADTAALPTIPVYMVSEEEYENRDFEPGKPVILVVDESPESRTFIKSVLGPYFNVVEAANGRDGISKAREILPDLVISDIMMPGMDGCELCKVLKKDIKTVHIPVILLTAKVSEECIVEGLETGADDYITKPFNAHMLVIRIKNLIRVRRLLQRKIRTDTMLQPREIPVSSPDREFIKELREVIERNLSEPGYNVEKLAKKLYMSPSTLYRKVEALSGESTTQFIRSYRLKRAAQLLKDNFGNVTEVAYAVGFCSTAYFTKCFKKKFKRLPSDFLGVHSGS